MKYCRKVLVCIALFFALGPTVNATAWSGWTNDQSYDIDGLALWWEVSYRNPGLFSEVTIEFDCDLTYKNMARCGTTAIVFVTGDGYDDWNPGWSRAYSGQLEWRNDTLTGEGSGPYIINGYIEWPE